MTRIRNSKPGAISPRPAGFTLVEVLVAMGVVAIGMSAAIKAVSGYVTNTTWMRDRTYAHWVAMNTLTELRLRDRSPEEEELDGDLEYAGRNWVWQAEISQTEVDNLFRVDIEVAFEEEPDLILRELIGFIGPSVAPATPGRVWAQQYLDEDSR